MELRDERDPGRAPGGPKRHHLRRWAARFAGLPVGLAAWLALALAAAAHENEVIRYGSFLGGLTHPVLGPDHLLAMLSVGVVSVQIGGKAILVVPATFVVVMALGGVLGLGTTTVPMEAVEAGISASVLVLGTIIAFARRLPVPLAMAAVAIFALFHGYAHGVETPSVAEPAQYAAGFVLGTALIHLFGVLIAEVAQQYASGPRVLRIAGAATGVVGALFLIGVA